MAYIGVTPSNVFGQGTKDSFDGDGSTTAFTLSRSVLLATDIEVFVGNVRQEPNVAYTVSGTTLTFTGTPASGTGNIYAVHQTANQGTLVPPTGLAINASTLEVSGTSTLTGNVTAAGTLDVTGVATATTFEPDGDTAAGDNAAIGFTSTEGLILTGQGSTNDVTIKNDADADVIEIPTGTTNVTVAGTLGTGGLITSGAGITIANDGQIGSVGDADAMTISSGGVVDFSVPPTGTGMTRLLTTTTTSAAANVTISNTYINSTFDTYFIMFNLRPVTDNVNMLIRYAVDGSTFITDSHYGWASYALDTNTGAYSSNSDTSWRISATPIGSSTGEGIHGYLYVVGANNTAFPSGIVGILNGYNNGSNHVAATFGGGQEVDSDARSQVINGLQFLTSDGNIASSEITVYGLDKS